MNLRSFHTELTLCYIFFFFFFNDTATTEIYTLSLHDALPICFGYGFLRPSLVSRPLCRYHAFFRLLVFPEPEKDRLPQQAITRDLLVTDLGQELRLDPMPLLLRGDRTLERRTRGFERQELVPDVFQHLAGESAARATGIDEPPVVVATQVERAESATGALGGGVAHDDEIPGLVGADLLPQVRAAALVRRVGFLGDDPLEAHPHGPIVQRLAVLLEMLRSEEHTSELQSLAYLVCRLLLEKKKKTS